MRKCCEGCEDYRNPAMCALCEETGYQAKAERDAQEEWEREQQEIAWDIEDFWNDIESGRD